MYSAIVGALYIVLNVINVGDLGPAYRAWLMARGPYPCMIPDFPTACDGYGAAGDAWQMKSLITLVLDFLLAGCAAGRGDAGRTLAGGTTANRTEETTVYKEEPITLPGEGGLPKPPDSTLSIEVGMVMMNLTDMGSVTAVTLMTMTCRGTLKGAPLNAVSSGKSLIWVMRRSLA